VSDYLTPAEMLVRGLGLTMPADTHAVDVPAGATCALGWCGRPIERGYAVGDITTDATNEFLDHFRGGGYLCEPCAIAFRNASPRLGNPTAKPVLVFGDGTYYSPMIARRSAAERGRACWSDLIREVWPGRQGQAVLVILTLDFKRRLWPRARVGALGERTPVLLDEGNTRGVVYVDWQRLIGCLDLVEEVYTAGFSKRAIRGCLLGETGALSQYGLSQALSWERGLGSWRGTPEFAIATFVAQKGEA